MATVTYGFPDEVAAGIVYTWTPLTQSNVDGQMAGCAPKRDHTFQVWGTFGGATIVLQGSMDGTNWLTCNDQGGNAVSFTTAGAKVVIEAFRYYRPYVSGASGTTALTAALLGGR